MIRDPFEKVKLAFVLFIYIFIPLNPLKADEFKALSEVDMLVWRCYKDMKSCKESLSKINDYQKKSALNKKFSCQTRLLGLEANLIMATNFNFKRKEAKSIIDFINKYC